MDEPRAIVPIVAYSAEQVAERMGYDVHAIYRATKDERNRLRSFTPNGNKRGMRILGKWILDWMERGADAAQKG